MAHKVCPICGSSLSSDFWTQEAIPSNSCLVQASPDDERGKGTIGLACCARCEHVTNRLFDSTRTLYNTAYESTQAFSPTFTSFQWQLAQGLTEKLDLTGKQVVEIGCGQGELLAAFRRAGTGRVVGFDPAYRTDDKEADSPLVIPDYFDGDHPAAAGDLFCCVMTLEHIEHPSAFTREIADAMQPGNYLYLQVPEAGRIFSEAAFEDVYYEHCQYFTPASLRKLLLDCELEVLNVDQLYSGQYVGMLARKTPGSINAQDDVAQSTLVPDCEHFVTRVEAQRNDWREYFTREGIGRAAIWGGGSKAVACLSGFFEPGQIVSVVDINPGRQGCYLAGTDKRIIAPAELRASSPDVIIVMNEVYREEITTSVNQLALDIPVLTLSDFRRL